MKTQANFTITEIFDGENTFVKWGISNSNITPPTNWSNSIPSSETNMFIWRKEGKGLTEDVAIWGDPICLTGQKGDTGEQGPPGETGKLTVNYSNNTITVQPLNTIGFINYNGENIQIEAQSKSFATGGEGFIIANLITKEIRFCKLSLGQTEYLNNIVKTILIIDYEYETIITTRHDSMHNYSLVKIGEFIIEEGGVIKSAALTDIEPIDSYFQKSFMKIFRMGKISSSDFEDWLEALDLKDFYQTLVVSNLFVNSLLANDGQFLNTLRISENNIEGTLNKSIDKQELFKNGLLLTQDGSIQGNYNKDLKTGWKIDGNGKAIFYKADLIDINVEGILTANHIDHNSLKTIDSKTAQSVFYKSTKNEWLSDNFFSSDNIPENIISFDCTADIEGCSFNKYIKFNSSNKYIHYVSDIIISNITHGTTKSLYNWTNNTGSWVLVEFKLLGDFGWTSDLYFRTRSTDIDCSDSDIVRILVAPNESVTPKFQVGGLWGSGTGTVVFFKAHNFYNNNTALLDFKNININFEIQKRNCPSRANPEITELYNFTIPNWCNYLLLEVFSEDGSFPNSFLLNSNSTETFEKINPIKMIKNIYFFAIPINNKNLTLKIQRDEKREYEDGSYDYSYYKKVNIKSIRIALGLNKSKGYTLLNTNNNVSQTFSESTYYSTSISLNSISAVYTKIKTIDFINQLQTVFGDNKNKWLIINKNEPFYFKINGSLNTNISQILLTESNLQFIDNEGKVENALPEARYEEIEIQFTPYSQTEHVKTGHLIPKNSTTNIGEENNEYLTARIKTIFATEVHGKCYAT